jgi:hypothetical protein
MCLVCKYLPLSDLSPEQQVKPVEGDFTDISAIQDNYITSDAVFDQATKTNMLDFMTKLNPCHKVRELPSLSWITSMIVYSNNFIKADWFDQVPGIQVVELIHCDIDYVPTLNNLTNLTVKFCDRIVSIANQPVLETLMVADALSLEMLGDFPELNDLRLDLVPKIQVLKYYPKLVDLHLSYCHGLTELRPYPLLESVVIIALNKLIKIHTQPKIQDLWLANSAVKYMIPQPRMKVCSIINCEHIVNVENLQAEKLDFYED